MGHAAPKLDQLIDLAVQLERDEERPLSQRRRRDRGIGRSLVGERRARVLGWLRAVESEEESGGALAQRALRLFVAVGIGMGFALGWATAGIVYRYDGSRPVNVVEVLAVFVLLQLVLWIPTLITALPEPARRGVPALAALQDGLSILSPGRWLLAGARWLPQRQRQLLDLVLGRGQRHAKLFGRVGKWAVLLGSQLFAVAFHLGAVVGGLYLVLFTDLAFGWSTTLVIHPASLQALTDGLSLPWAAWASDAVPSRALIDATRFFRLDAGILSGGAEPDPIDPAALGGWWPFCLACMACYGLAPRVIGWAVAQQRFGAAIGAAFDRMPGLAELCDRLEQPLVETAADEPERDGLLPGAVAPQPLQPFSERGCRVINWSALEVSDDVLQSVVAGAVDRPVIDVHPAGGARSLADDREVIRRLAESGAETSVVVVVRAWEPPVLEFVDFVSDLRSALGEAVSIAIIPVALGADGGPEAAPEADFSQWQRRLIALGDPWLSIRALAGASE